MASRNREKLILHLTELEDPCLNNCFYITDKTNGCLNDSLGQNLVAIGHVTQVLA